MSQPFKLRYQNEIVGLFLLGAVVFVFVVGLLLARTGGDTAEETFELDVTFDAIGLGPLHEGVPVRLRAQRIGRVVRSGLGDDRKMRATLALSATLRGLLPIDSVAVLYTPMAGLAGETYLEIAPGSAPMRAQVGDAIAGRVAGDVLQLATDLLIELNGTVGPALVALRRVSLRADGLLGRFEEAIGMPEAATAAGDALQRAASLANRAERTFTKVEALLDRLDVTLDRVDTALVHADGALQTGGRVLARVDRGEGLIGRALQDPALERQVTAMISQLSGLIATVDRVASQSATAVEGAPELLAEGRQALRDMAAVASELRRLAPAVPSMVGQIDELLGEGRAALDAASRHWLIGSALRPDGPPRPLGLSGVRDAPLAPDLDALRRALAPRTLGDDKAGAASATPAGPRAAASPSGEAGPASTGVRRSGGKGGR